MAKTIKEMTDDYAIVASIIIEEAKAGRSAPLSVSNIFMNGANAVLEEIESFCQLFNNKHDGFEVPVECMLGKINQLKGK